MASSTVKVKAAKQPKLAVVKAPKPVKIAPPTKQTTQAEKQVAAFEKQYLTQQKELVQQYKALGLHSVAEKTATPTSGASRGSLTAPYHRYP